MASVLKPDPFNAVLLASEPLLVSAEQAEYIKKVLDRASSDSRFADKAFIAIWKILTAGSVVPPEVTALVPDEAALGTPSFTLHVNGTGFTPESVINWNGSPEPTTFVSPTDVTTEVDMTTAAVAAEIPVSVETNGVVSNALTFSLVL